MSETFIDLSIWQFPLSFLLAITFLASVYAIWQYMPDCRVRRWFEGRTLCIVSTIMLTIMLAIEGTWGIRFHRHISFWIVALLMMASIQFDILNQMKAKWHLGKKQCFRSLVSGKMLSHLGFFLIAFGAFWGAPDVQDSRMVVTQGDYNRIAYTRENHTLIMPFAIRLDTLNIEYYADGKSPKQFTSNLDIDGTKCETSVNHPCYYQGYWIYQSSYGNENGVYSVLQVIADPWLPVIYLGMLLLAVGAFMRISVDWNSRYLIIAVILLALLFTVLSVIRINFSMLMPALRSWWFVPHLVLYMVAYSSLALGLVLVVLSLCGFRKEKLMSISDKLFNTSSSLLLMGMLCGSVWAKAAWGDWWMWDAKENWAAVTWLVTLVGIHLPHGMSRRNAVLALVMLFAFLAMQMAWYGVEHVPAAKESLHTYKS